MVEGRWQPGIGDPTWIGWFTVVAYLLAALLCGVCWFRSRWRSGFWLFLGVVLILLGINKQLDLQSWLTAFGRQMALENGWYHQRRQVQIEFMIILGLMAIAVFSRLGVVLYGEYKRRRVSSLSSGLSLAGLGFLACFIVIRASSFHHVDQFLGWQWAGLTMNGFLELTGISLMAIGAGLNLRRLR
jgi:hypothetical protein